MIHLITKMLHLSTKMHLAYLERVIQYLRDQLMYLTQRLTDLSHDPAGPDQFAIHSAPAKMLPTQLAQPSRRLRSFKSVTQDSIN